MRHSSSARLPVVGAFALAPGPRASSAPTISAASAIAPNTASDLVASVATPIGLATTNCTAGRMT